MGYASTLEAITERLNEALFVASSIPDDPHIASDEQRAAFERALSALLGVVCEARSYLDIATDPTLDIAQRLLAEQRNSQSHAARAHEATVTALRLKQSLDSERETVAKLRAEVADLWARVHRTDNALEKAYGANPSGVLGAYSGGSVTPRDSDK